MTQLISKVQFKRSEKSEFHQISERNFEETITLILNYPWEAERGKADVELTCPSVTIEHPTEAFLKIGPYFSGKFCIYHLNPQKKVYFLVVNTLEDATNWVRQFFEQNGRVVGFKKYSFTINPSSHFRTNTFEYTVGTKAILKFFEFPIYMMAIFLFIGFLKQAGRDDLNPDIHVMMILFNLFISSPLIYLFFNYLPSEKESYIQISKGHDEFVYGTLDSKKQFRKSDVAQINAYGVRAYRNSRSIWRTCEIITIDFKNGDQIQFTTLLISGETLRRKFPEHKFIDNKLYFPTIGSV